MSPNIKQLIIEECIRQGKTEIGIEITDPVIEKKLVHFVSTQTRSGFPLTIGALFYNLIDDKYSYSNVASRTRWWCEEYGYAYIKDVDLFQGRTFVISKNYSI